jgi:hypothetical protein
MADKRQSRADKGKARGSYKEKWGRERDADVRGDWVKYFVEKAVDLVTEVIRNRNPRR